MRLAGAVFAAELVIMLDAGMEVIEVLLAHHPPELGGAAGPDLARADHFLRRHEGAGRDHRTALDHRLVHDAGGHADHRVVLDRTSMDHRHVADHHAAADLGPLPLARDMDDGAVLDVRA